MTQKTNTCLFISDLHLEDQRPDITQAFLHFLEHVASKAQTLYILGDFFNVWVGDDASNELSELVATSLQKLSEKDTTIFLMHGNRDFLLGPDFANKCGARLITEPYLLEVEQESYLLLHGDCLCTKDIDYMAFRNMVRNPDWQRDFLNQSLQARQAFAEQARQKSKAMSSNKAEDIMDVTQAEVEKLMAKYQVATMIHGHTHRPASHHFSTNKGELRRIVLGDWDQQGWYLELNAKQLELKTIALPE